jgi:hypothetical protein
LKIDIGKVSTIADKVMIKLSFTANMFGKNLKTLSKNSFVYKIHKTAKKLN